LFDLIILFIVHTDVNENEADSCQFTEIFIGSLY
jgi:hypothetical protein